MIAPIRMGLTTWRPDMSPAQNHHNTRPVKSDVKYRVTIDMASLKPQ